MTPERLGGIIGYVFGMVIDILFWWTIIAWIGKVVPFVGKRVKGWWS
jgi:hypothetical protein